MPNRSQAAGAASTSIAIVDVDGKHGPDPRADRTGVGAHRGRRLRRLRNVQREDPQGPAQRNSLRHAMHQVRVGVGNALTGGFP